MAPQNVSFIDSSAEEELQKKDTEEENKAKDPESPRLKRLPERLSQLKISSGSKTYRVHADDNRETTSPPYVARPTISSAFKQNRRSSGGTESTGPASLRSAVKSEEEEETLANMKTERLKEDKDAAAGFVISFDDNESRPRRPKPALKPKRPSTKKTSTSEVVMSSDGSNSSRKENVPPEVMICIVSPLACSLWSWD